LLSFAQRIAPPRDEEHCVLLAVHIDRRQASIGRDQYSLGKKMTSF